MTPRLSRIAELNDRCRLGLDPAARVVITATCLATFAPEGSAAGELAAESELLAAIRAYGFRPDECPERSRGEFTIRGQAVRFMIDYYDPALDWGSEDPADPRVTTRVMTIMLPLDD